MLPYWTPSLWHIQEKLQRCTTCCQGTHSSFHCPICPKTKFKPTRLAKVKSHLHDGHWNYREKCVVGKKVTYALPCRLTHGKLVVGSRNCHYHCPICRVTIVSRYSFNNHVRNACKVLKEKQQAGEVDDVGDHYIDTTIEETIAQSFGETCDHTIKVDIDGELYVVKVPSSVAEKINKGDSDTVKMIYDAVRKTKSDLSQKADQSDEQSMSSSNIQSALPAVSTQPNVTTASASLQGSIISSIATAAENSVVDMEEDGIDSINDDSVVQTMISPDPTAQISMPSSALVSQHDYSMITPEVSGVYHWTSDAVNMVIESYRVRMHLFSNKNVKPENLWVEIEEEMAEQGFNYTAESIEEKWKSLLKMYRKTRYCDVVTDNKPDFYDDIHEFLKGRTGLERVETPDVSSNNLSDLTWSGHATTFLLDSYRRRLDQFNDSSIKKRTLYMDISEEMADAGYSFTGEQINGKWKGLTKAYKRFKAGYRTQGFIYADQMEGLLGDSHGETIFLTSSVQVENVLEGDLLSQVGAFIDENSSKKRIQILSSSPRKRPRQQPGQRRLHTKRQLVDYFRDCINQQIAKEEQDFEQLKTLHEEKIAMLNNIAKTLDGLS